MPTFLRLSGLTATAVLLGTGELQSGRAYAAPRLRRRPVLARRRVGRPGARLGRPLDAAGARAARGRRSQRDAARPGHRPLRGGHGRRLPPRRARRRGRGDRRARPLGPRRGARAPPRIRVLLPFQGRRGHELAWAGRARRRSATSTRCASRSRAASAGRKASTPSTERSPHRTSTSWSSSATTSTRTGSAPQEASGGWRCPQAAPVRVHHPRPVPVPVRPVQVRQGPAGRTCGTSVARDLGRPRGQRQLRRAHPQRRTADRRASFPTDAPPATRRSLSTSRWGVHRSPRASTCRSTAACRTAGSQTSGCSTAASTGASRPAAATSPRRARSRSTRRARCSAPGRRRGCSMGCADRKRPGTCSRSR